MSSDWTIELTENAKKDLKQLGRPEAKRIVQFLQERVAGAGDARRLGKALTGPRYEHLWRYRVGDYRIVCELHEDWLVVLMIEIGHRRDIYR
ncbi:type II toxin-antitoxin system RelE/ParE family toxin [Rhizobium sp. FKL33]|uniref:type II toxin-antitoxin system RelE family toxin n=1 Tax=Rhizobium sp. FKL33 TaxID=2562307 RepID=UPI001485A2FD|nr:type II toxin-antitoxin system RelE/ParE family toxin [Rhizobium sp. FKL33]